MYYKERKIYREVKHALEHAIRNADGDNEMVINLLTQILKDHKAAKRRNDK